MHGDFQNNFIRTHLLYHANQQAISAREILEEVNSHGYNVTEEKIEKQLSHLAAENFLSTADSSYMITDSGKKELESVQKHLKPLYEEVGRN
ncbi:winged-helix domain-containing protein [Planococcus halotolerans]|uniref:Ribonuclease R winged-helix domain-containing protein n=1 Tax=Planococcus halotolerans TaxID=2233542 RepID=A0A365KUF8_9BACL|nr:winged-helix domain-containing protein [Planococcus halotolerans]QHJ71334.1 hypothetical protein DNR44_012170 [Planococcus halotolerans]RAZ76810.1 hypothetical protein DP120_12345 [Planococcus halotolerans]